MAGFYNVPYSSVAKKPVIEGVLVNTTPNQSESFMDVAKAIRFCTYKYMKVEPESCEVLPMGENKEIDKDVNPPKRHDAQKRKSAEAAMGGILFSFVCVDPCMNKK